MALSSVPEIVVPEGRGREREREGERGRERFMCVCGGRWEWVKFLEVYTISITYTQVHVIICIPQPPILSTCNRDGQGILLIGKKPSPFVN